MPGSHVHKRACHVGSTIMKIEAAVFWADGKQGIKFAWPYVFCLKGIIIASCLYLFYFNLKGEGYGKIHHCSL